MEGPLHCGRLMDPSADCLALFLPELEKLVKLAQSSNVVLIITLWSFDMCKQETSTGYHPQMFTDMTVLQSYINNALIPMLTTLNKYDNIIWEVINEPEWCIKETPGNTNFQATLAQMQRFAGAIADGIHKNSRQPVTLGSASLKWNSATPAAVGNWWNDTSLRTQFPSSDAKLDFYQFHYYDWAHNDQWGYDPCRVPASYWKLDKPTIVGELPATGGSFYTPNQLLDCSLKNNYWGVLFWSYAVDFDWHQAVTAWNQFYDGHTNLCSYANLVNWVKSLRQ